MKKVLFVVLIMMLLLAMVLPAFAAGQTKVDVCHLDVDGNYILMNIPDPAVEAHLAHGDEIAGGEVLDENCEPVPLARYVDNGDGTVLDRKTNLIWLKNAYCYGWQTWYDATALAANLSDGQCGLVDGSSAGDWRLPTNAEWQLTLVDSNALRCELPNLSDTAGTGCYADETAKIFIDVQSDYGYWTSTEYDINRAQYRDMPYGDNPSVNKTDYWLFWPVRSGQ